MQYWEISKKSHDFQVKIRGFLGFPSTVSFSKKTNVKHLINEFI